VIDDASGDDVEAVFFHWYEHETKTSTERTVPAQPRAAEIIRQLSDVCGGGPFFPWAKGSSTPWLMWDTIRSDLKAGGMNIDDVVLHTLRHTCANRLRRSGHPLEEVQRWLGHSSMAVTADVYTHVDSLDLFHSMQSKSNGAKRTIRDGDGATATVHIPLGSRANRANSGTVLN
jgi:integrase